MRLPMMLLVLLMGADAPEPVPAPAEPPPAPTAGEAQPAGADPAASAEAPAEPAPPAPAQSGEEVLARAVAALTEGDYDLALTIAIPAMSAWPELAPSFKAVVDVAADQNERRRQGATGVAGAAPGPYAPPGARTGTEGYGRPPGYGYPRRNRGELLWGFDFGFPTGVRVEWKLGRRVVDSLGLRVGGNFLLYGSVYPVTDLTFFMDWKVAEVWQIETTTGLFVYYGWPYAQIGAAAQYDPKGPMHINAGAKIGPYGSLMPDLAVGFVW